MATPLNILIVEDSEDDLFLLLHALRKGERQIEYLRVDAPEAMRSALKERHWDAVTSDYNMPRFSALAALELLQESGLDLPFVVVSGKIGEDQAVAAMKAGAHDYVMKQNLSRLLPAIEREIREADERRRRREAEIALNRQFAQFKTIFDAMNAVVYVADMENFEVLYMNHYGEAIFGEQWRGRSCFDLFQRDQVGQCRFCTNDRLVKDGVPQPAVTSEHRSTLNGRWYQWTDRAIEWTDGRLVRLQIAVDITDIKEMERLKDEMISAVSHEMRTPLTAMLGFTEFLLENDVEKDKVRNYLVTIHKETERLNGLIGTFLDLQRLKSRVGVSCIGSVAVPGLITEAAELFAASRGGNLNLVEVACQPGLPQVRGDREKLHQVMVNLLSNACKYSPPASPIRITAALKEGEVVISVQDQGIGIPVEMRKRVFEKFFRIDNSDNRMIGGTGLGLALVKEIVESHGGRVWVEGEEGKGSTFCLALPLLDYETAPVDA
jgi:PAS domain S-box-containing protein